MNYRHAFHAGNFADVFKHVLLSRILVHLARKPTPFRYLDTHSGIGAYDLDGAEARRSGEWRLGIGRLDLSVAPPAVQELLAPYLEALGPRDAEGRPSLYPGSPLLALALTRPQDRLTFCELHPADAARLREAAGRGRRAKVVAIDGYTALKAYVPPPERRGVVLIDPPFEQRTEFEAMAGGLLAAHRKWPTGAYALWYPLKDPAAVARFTTGLMASGMPRMAQVELMVEPDLWGKDALAGCGMVLVNPPFGLEQEAEALLPFLAKALARQEPASWRWRWLAGERTGPG
jgi:23S rRNA (adenine2030-N6)-methyltransferase